MCFLGAKNAFAAGAPPRWGSVQGRGKGKGKWRERTVLALLFPHFEPCWGAVDQLQNVSSGLFECKAMPPTLP